VPVVTASFEKPHSCALSYRLHPPL
jgi:hypothetical protein